MHFPLPLNVWIVWHPASHETCWPLARAVYVAEALRGATPGQIPALDDEAAVGTLRELGVRGLSARPGASASTK